MAIEITGKQFNPKTVKRFVQKQFEKNGLVFTDKDPEIGRRLVREGGSSLAKVNFFLRSGLKLTLGIKFDVERGKIEPKSKGLIYNAKLGATVIPLAKPKGEDYDWTSFVKKISEHVKKKEETYKPKAPVISKARATDDKIPSSFKGKLEAKRTELDSKKEELAKQEKLLEDQTKDNETLESEIEGFKGQTEPSGKQFDSYYREGQKPAFTKAKPSHVMREARDKDSNVIDGIQLPYDGTEEGAKKVAQDVTKLMWKKYPGIDKSDVQISSSESPIIAMDSKGKPKWKISPNFAQVTNI